MQNFLLSSTVPPVIRETINKATLREEKGLPIFDFSSGSIGKLLFKINLFDKIDIKVNENLPLELKVIAEAIKEGFRSVLSNPKGFIILPDWGKLANKKACNKIL
jgi:hypothetical protein